MHTTSTSQIQLQQLGQSFSTNESQVELFKQLNLTIKQGQSYAITGPSGAGKSSLLMLMSGLEQPTQGSCFYQVGDAQHSLSDIREHIGFIFQQFHLLPELTALHNVALPLKLRGDKQAEQKAQQWLTRVGLGHRLSHKPKMLSGGEQQRVAIARALIFEPKFIFADEPTGNLDEKSAGSIADLLFATCDAQGAGLVVVTHSAELAARAQHTLTLKNGECHAISQRAEVA